MFAGARPYSNDNVAATVAEVKASGPAMIHALKIRNTTAGAAYLQVFAKPAASVNLGTDTPAFFVPLAASESVTIPLTMPIRLDGSGLSLAGTTGAGNSSGAQLSILAVFE
jgi:hypothetical protein